MNKNILVFGGSGYIGSSIIGKLLELGYEVTNLDKELKLFNSKYTYLPCDLSDKKVLNNFNSLDKFKSFDCAINLAAYKDIEESVINPIKYYTNNVQVLLNTIEICSILNVPKYIFSSSAAIYKDKIGALIESDELTRYNAYSDSKIICEEILNGVAKNFKSIISLRYFNPIGSTEYSLDISDSLFGNIYNSIRTDSTFKIYGNNYESKDGTCIRDFIDLRDLVDAHLFFIDKNINNKFDAFNVGSGNETTVLDVVKTVKELYPNFKYEYSDRRLGDTVGCYADTTKINKLGFKCKYSLLDSIKSILEKI